MNACEMIARCARHQRGDEPTYTDLAAVRTTEATPACTIGHQSPSDRGVDGARSLEEGSFWA